MATQSSKLIVEAMMVLFGRESPQQFVVSVFMFALGDTLLTREVLSMDDFIYYPEDMLPWVALILVVTAIAGPALIGLFKKNQSKTGKTEEWQGKYKATMLIDMILTPAGGLIVTSFIAQKLGGINDLAYLCFLPFICLGVSWFLLTLMNEGWKAVAEQMAAFKEGAEETQKILKP